MIRDSHGNHWKSEKLDVRGIKITQVFILACFFLMGCSDDGIALPTRGVDGNLPSEGIGKVAELPDISLKKSVQDELHYEDVYKKTLFNPERTFVESEKLPEEETTPTPTKQAVDLPNLDLVGTLKTSDDMSYAFIRNSGAGSKNVKNMVTKYALGQWIGEYLITKIETSRVTLMKGQEVAIIRLKPSGKPAARQSGTGGRRPGEGARPASKPNEKGSETESNEKQMGRSRMKADVGSESTGADKAQGQETRKTRPMASGNYTRFPCGN